MRGKIYFYAITAGWIQAAINIELPMRKIRTTYGALFTRIQDLYPVIRMRYTMHDKVVGDIYCMLRGK